MTYRLPPTLAAEIDELENRIRLFDRGEISDSELKAFRVPFGIYEQRVRGLYMVRIRCAAGMITPSQLSEVASLAEKYGTGRLHVTTRQEIQIHDLPIESLVPVLRSLQKVGLATRGGGGNTVRNITASWDSGISADEAFDVTPYAVELTSRMIEKPDSWLLPRKFKIAVSSSAADTAYATFNDVGFIARIKDGLKGFRVFVAGGMGRAPQPGQQIHDFIEDTRIFEVAEAVKRLFSRYGNRRNKHTARLRFLWNTLGRDKFIALYNKELEVLRKEGYEPSITETVSDTVLQENPVQKPETETRDALLWKKRYSYEQPQGGLWSVKLPLSFGDIEASNALEIAKSVSVLGEDVIRFSHDQNIVFRNIPECFLPTLFNVSRKFSRLSAVAPVLSNAVACAGASTCQLGICLSRGALNAATEKLSQSALDLDSLENFRIHFSGCPNSCGHHGLADIGFSGKALRKNGHLYPAYSIVAGAAIDSSKGSSLAQPVGDIPARAVPEFLLKFLSRYIEKRADFDSYRSYLNSEGIETIRSICMELQEVPSFTENPHWYRDWGAETVFTLEGRGTGECSAGLFDMIELDLAKARKAKESLTSAQNAEERDSLLHDILFYSARSLLVTKTGEITRESEVPVQFKTHFTGLVSESAGRLAGLLGPGEHDPLHAREKEILSFAEEITMLYASLDESHQFHKQEHASDVQSEPDLEADLRGVSCPMNFVKTKMALSHIEPGQILKVLLDDGEPVENVPRSAAAEGHEVVGKQQHNDYWSVIIKKAE